MPAAASATCPTGYDYCDGGDTNDICTQDVDGNITCDLGANGAGSTSSVKAYTNSGGDFEAWGTDGDTNDFCCNFEMECQDVVTIQGTDYTDIVDLNGVATSLDCVVDYVYGDGGGDDITGSAGTSYDHLYGEAGNDTISGLADVDYIDGGSDNDVLYGNGGNDTIYGGTGDDFIYGGLGDDVLYGEDGYDRIKGEAGNDTIEGGDHDDKLCGGFDADAIDGGGGDDKIDGGPQADTVDGGASAGTDECMANSGGDSYADCDSMTYVCDI